MTSPEPINSTPELAPEASFIPPNDQSQLPAQDPANPYATFKPPHVFDRDFAEGVNKMRLNNAKEYEIHQRLEGLTKELNEDKKVLKEMDLKTRQEREAHNKDIYDYVKARDRAEAKVVREQAKITPGVFDFEVGYMTSINYSVHVGLRDQCQDLQNKEKEIRGKENDVVEMQKKVAEKELEKQKSLEQQSEIIKEYHRIKKQLNDVMERTPDHHNTPISPAVQIPPTSLASGSGGRQKRARSNTTGSGSIAPKKTKKAVDDNIPQSLPPTSAASTSTPKPPTSDGTPNKK